MKVFVLAPSENWICDRLAQEWNENNRDISCDYLDSDILWLLAGWCWNRVPPTLLNDKKVVVTIHHVVPEKFDDTKKGEFLFRDQFVDAYHVPNSKTELFVRGMTSKPVHVIPYWYNSKIWYPEDRRSCRAFFNLPASKFVVGSFQRDTEGGTKNPKLEKGPDLLCNFLDDLKKHRDVHVLLGGWRREYVIDRLDSSGIGYSFFEMADVETLRKMYCSCDLYVVSSRYEGGPQAIIECSATNTPIVSRDVGIAKDVLHSSCISDSLLTLKTPGPESVRYNFESVDRLEINQHKKAYIEMFEEVYNG